MRKTTIGLAIAGVAAVGAAAIGGTAWAAGGTGEGPAPATAPVVSEETAAPGGGETTARDRDCPEKSGGQAPGEQSPGQAAPGGADAPAAETL
jgi:hypothetical protein